jgi:hypothetical protein
MEWLYGEEFATDKLASATTRQSCSPIGWVVPREGMCWEQSHEKRTIATSRRDDNLPDSGNNSPTNYQPDSRKGDYAQRYRYAATPMETAWT